MFTCGKQVKYYENGKNKETTVNKNNWWLPTALLTD